MGEQWWCKAQENRADELVFFTWSGYPRWPGVVVKPDPKRAILAGQGHFFKPKISVFTECWTEARRAPVRIGKTYAVKRGGHWLSGKITRANLDGTFDANLVNSDGELSELEFIARDHIQ